MHWVDRLKHRPPPGVPWKRLIEESKQNAYYHLDYSSPDARRGLETQCIREGICFRHDQDGKQCYYLKMDRIVGASKGEETEYVYAEISSGNFHGWPITAAELRRKGVQL